MTNEKMYWPWAETSGGTRLFTSEPACDLASALRQFDIWADAYQYDIKKAWITVTPGDTKLKVEKKWVVASNAAAEKPEKDKGLTKEELAHRLSYAKAEVQSLDIDDAQENGLVIVWMNVDGELEFEGAMSILIENYAGPCYLSRGGVYFNENEAPVTAKKIEVLQGESGMYRWWVRPNFPAAPFGCESRGEKISIGCVFSMEDLE